MPKLLPGSLKLNSKNNSYWTNLKRLVARYVRPTKIAARPLQDVQSLAKKGFFFPLNLPALSIDSVATNEQLALCATKIKSAWEHLGAATPHFSVLTGEQFLPENLDGAIDDFWSTGQAEAEIFRQTLSRHGVEDLSSGICVEYGCGVGRVTMGFVKQFAKVHAYDISSNHLKIARQRAEETGTGNAVFHECAEHFLDAIELCDFFYSVIVLQHNPPPIIVVLIRKALTALRPGGVAIFQVPTYIVGYRFSLEEWLNTDHVPDMQMHCLPQDKIFGVISEERCKLLEVREDNWTGAPEMYISNTFVVQKYLADG